MKLTIEFSEIVRTNGSIGFIAVCSELRLETIAGTPRAALVLMANALKRIKKEELERVLCLSLK